MTNHRHGPLTDRLELRALNVEDADALYALNSDPEVMRYTGEPPLKSLQDARQAIADYPDFDTVGFGRWGCVLRENGLVIGFCGLKYLADLDAVDVGYRLLPAYWGQGLATEACQASVAYGLSVLKLPRILGLVMPGNTASIRVLEKAALRFDTEFDYEGSIVLQYSIRRPTNPNALDV